jgi:hypothetical protein
MNTATQETPAQRALAEAAASQPPAVVERVPRRETIVVESIIPTLDTAMFEHMQRIAKMMASSSLVPAHLNSVRRVGGEDIAVEPQEAVANCFLVVNQAIRWRMDPFAVAQHVYTTKGRIGYEGKLIAAVINSHPAIEKRLTYRYEGTPRTKERKVVVTAKIKGDDEARSIEGIVKQWETTGSGSPWSDPDDYDQMLAYRGAREWARRWLPEAILGVWGDDEIRQFETTEHRLAQDERPQAAPTRGAAGLRQALVGQQVAAAQTHPSSAQHPDSGEHAAATGNAEQSASAAPAEKQPGTPAQRDAIIAKLKSCTDTEILSLAMDAAREMDWTKPDLDTIEAEYRAMLAKLEG